MRSQTEVVSPEGTKLSAISTQILTIIAQDNNKPLYEKLKTALETYSSVYTASASEPQLRDKRQANVESTLTYLTNFRNALVNHSDKEEALNVFLANSKAYCKKTCNRSTPESIIRGLLSVLMKPGFTALTLFNFDPAASMIGIPMGYFPYIGGGISLLSCFYFIYKKNVAGFITSFSGALVSAGMALTMFTTIPMFPIVISIALSITFLAALYVFYLDYSSHVAKPSFLANPLQKASADLANTLMEVMESAKTSSTTFRLPAGVPPQQTNEGAPGPERSTGIAGDPNRPLQPNRNRPLPPPQRNEEEETARREQAEYDQRNRPRRGASDNYDNYDNYNNSSYPPHRQETRNYEDQRTSDWNSPRQSNYDNWRSQANQYDSMDRRVYSSPRQDRAGRDDYDRDRYDTNFSRHQENTRQEPRGYYRQDDYDYDRGGRNNSRQNEVELQDWRPQNDSRDRRDYSSPKQDNYDRYDNAPRSQQRGDTYPEDYCDADQVEGVPNHSYSSMRRLSQEPGRSNYDRFSDNRRDEPYPQEGRRLGPAWNKDTRRSQSPSRGNPRTEYDPRNDSRNRRDDVPRDERRSESEESPYRSRGGPTYFSSNRNEERGETNDYEDYNPDARRS